MGGQEFSYVPKIMNGGLAGVVGVTCVFPIDLVKTRLQNQPILPNGEVQYKGILDCAKQTWRSGGVSMFSKVRALYSGAGVNILLITPEKAIKLVANDFFRYHLAVPGQKGLPAWRGMIAGGLAGMFQIIVTTPMELLKIQMQDQGRTAVAGQKKLTALELTGKLLRERGIAGLYKGLSSTFARDVTFSMMYFPLFAYLDSLGPRKSDGSGDAVFWTSFVAGLSAGAASSFTVTPLDVIKTRMQTITKGAHEIRYKSVPDAFMSSHFETSVLVLTTFIILLCHEVIRWNFYYWPDVSTVSSTSEVRNRMRLLALGIVGGSKILQMEGPRALFKGAACRMMVMAPLFGIAQTVYYVGVAEKILGVQKATHV